MGSSTGIARSTARTWQPSQFAGTCKPCREEQRAPCQQDLKCQGLLKGPAVSPGGVHFILNRVLQLSWECCEARRGRYPNTRTPQRSRQCQPKVAIRKVDFFKAEVNTELTNEASWVELHPMAQNNLQATPLVDAILRNPPPCMSQSFLLWRGGG